MVYCRNYGSSIIRKSWRGCSNVANQTLERSPSQQLQPNSSKDQPAPSQQISRKKGKPSQSIIIGVILIAIILMIVLIIGFVLFPEWFIRKDTTPTVIMVWHSDPYELGTGYGMVTNISGSDSINLDEVTASVTHGGQSGSKDLDDIAESGTLEVGTFTLDLTDNSPMGKLGSEDFFTITGSYSGDTLRLIYKPTGGQMCLITFY